MWGNGKSDMVGQASRLDVCVQNVFFLGGTAVLLFVFQLTDQSPPRLLRKVLSLLVVTTSTKFLHSNN